MFIRNVLPIVIIALCGAWQTAAAEICTPPVEIGPCFDSSSSSQFTARKSESAAITFTAESVVDGDESIVRITPPAGVIPSITVHDTGIDAGSPMLPGGETRTIGGHSVTLSISTAGEYVITIPHDGHDATETWFLRVDGITDFDPTTEDVITVAGEDFADFNIVQLLPYAFPGNDQTVFEGGSQTLGTVPPLGDARVRRWDLAGATPSLTYSWSQTSPVSAPLPDTDEDIDVTPPSVTVDETLIYELTVTDNTYPEHGSMVNASSVNLVVQAISPRDVYLVLDHSGSMNSNDKWPTTVTAASLFIDLLRGLRKDDLALPTASRSRVGHLIFASSSCGWGSGSATDNATTGPFGDLASVNPSVNIYGGGPSGCTPIGDGIDAAKQDIATPRGDPTFVVMTDGMENSGSIRLQTSLAELTSGTTELASTVFGPGWIGTNFERATFHSLTVGDTEVAIQRIMEELTFKIGSGEGVWRNVSNLADRDLESFYQQTLGDIIGAQLIEGAQSGQEWIFPVNAGELRVAFILVWDPSATGSQMYYPVLSNDAGGWASSVTWDSADNPSNPNVEHSILETPGYSFIVVDRDRDAGRLIDGNWTVSIGAANGSDLGTVPTAATPRVFALVDPHLFARFDFQRVVRRAGDPFLLTTEIVEGGRPVTGATVAINLDKSAQGEGTFLVNNLPQLDLPPRKKYQLRGDRSDRRMALDLLFDQLGIDGLGIDSDVLQLFDDGDLAKGDLIANDGIYSNYYSDTSIEGAYSFTFTASGQANSGTLFARTGTVSGTIRVAVDPVASAPTWSNLPSTGGVNRAEVRILPQSAASPPEYYGPFAADGVTFDITDGTPDGPVVDYGDGSYGQIVTYRDGQVPVAVVTVDGVAFPPSSPSRPIDKQRLLFWLFAILVLILLFLIYRCVCHRSVKQVSAP